MTFEIGLTLAILIAAIILFITEVIRVDLVALAVLVTLALTGLLKPDQALSGFSNPAVITIWAMFILSAGLSRTGISNLIGNQIIRFARGGDGKLVAVLMTVTGLLSAFMNNIGVAAMFLPVTLDIARRTQRHASKLLIPMAYGSLLGGLLLLIGTSSNLIVRDALREAGFAPLGMLDFTPIGIIILVVCVAYMALIGRRFLPIRVTPGPLAAGNQLHDLDFRSQYGLEERLAYLILPEASPLAGKTLSESRISRALGLNVLNIQRKNGQRIPPGPNVYLAGGDRLLIVGRLDRIDEIASRPVLTVEEKLPVISQLISQKIGLAEFRVSTESRFQGKTLARINLRRNFGVNVLAIRHGEIVRRTNLQNIPLDPEDRLLLQGPVNCLEAFQDQSDFRFLGVKDAEDYHLEERLLFIDIPTGSSLAGRTLEESRLGAAYGLAALSITRNGEEWRMPQPDDHLQEGDVLIVGGRPQDIDCLRGLSTLKVDRNVDVNAEKLEDGPFQIVEVMLSPHTSLSGKTLSDLLFREKYGVSVLAIWRGDRSYRTGLNDFPLHYGDALLCYGPIERFEWMARDRNFVVLKAAVQEKPRSEKALLSVSIMLAVVTSVIVFDLPISIAAITGCVLMIVTRCLTMDEAYQGIDWRAVFLIAAMLPLGIAMQQTGAASLLANWVIDTVGIYGPQAILAALMILSMLAIPVLPAAVIAVIMSPIAVTTAVNMGVSPYPFMLGIAYALAAACLSPVAHPANVLVMSPGGYRFSDYLKQGLPISLIVLAISVPLLPVLFPF